MSRFLEGKNVVITGASRGMGKEILRNCARNGANVWACMRNPSENVEIQMKEMMEEYGVTIWPVYFDLKKEKEIKEGARAILKMKCPIHAIVNNAGITGPNRLFEMTSMEEIREVFEVNFFSAISFTQKLLKYMIKNNAGSIVNISSVAALDGEPAQLEYVASKAALLGATRKLANELGKFKIRVNAIAPGLTDTDMIQKMQNELLQKSIEKIALSRLGSASEIAEMVAFLISDRSSYITGQTIRVDGGIY